MRLLRLVILIGGLNAVAAIFVVGFFNPFATKLGSLGFRQPFGGRNQDRHGSAEACWIPQRQAALPVDGRQALQDIKHQTIVELQKVDGEIGMAGGGTDPLERGCWRLRQRERAHGAVEECKDQERSLHRTVACPAPSSILSPEFMEATTLSGSPSRRRHNRVCRSGCGGQPRSRRRTFEGHVQDKHRSPGQSNSRRLT